MYMQVNEVVNLAMLPVKSKAKNTQLQWNYSTWLLQYVIPPPRRTWNLKELAWMTVVSVQPEPRWLQPTVGREFPCIYFLW